MVRKPSLSLCSLYYITICKYHQVDKELLSTKNVKICVIDRILGMRRYIIFMDANPLCQIMTKYMLQCNTTQNLMYLNISVYAETIFNNTNTEILT
jgi:hypothetical protein